MTGSRPAGGAVRLRTTDMLLDAGRRTDRGAILDAALDVFVLRGYESLTIGAIARGADMDADDVVLAFGSKANLVGRLLDREECRVVTRIIDATAHARDDEYRPGVIGTTLATVLDSLLAVEPSWRAVFVADHGSFDDGRQRARHVRRVLERRLGHLAAVALGPHAERRQDVAGSIAALLAALVEARVRAGATSVGAPSIWEVAGAVESLLRIAATAPSPLLPDGGAC